MKPEHIYTEAEAKALIAATFEELHSNGYQVYLTGNGTLCIVFSHKSGGVCPVLGAYYDGAEQWVPAKWDADGQYLGINPNTVKTGLDLIMVNSAEKEMA